MAVTFLLKKIILQGSDSTQAVESFFRALKLYQSQEFGKRLPTLTDLIPSIAKAIDQQFGNRQRLVENKRTVYQHADSMLVMEQLLTNCTMMKILYWNSGNLVISFFLEFGIP